MRLFQFKPARDAAVARDADVVADLDALIERPIAFKLNGRQHALNPMTMQQWLKVTNGLGRLDALNRKLKTEDVKESEMIAEYHRFFSSVCPTMTEDLLLEMTHAQRGALLQLVIDYAGAKAHVKQAQADEKKNTQLTTPTASA